MTVPPMIRGESLPHNNSRVARRLVLKLLLAPWPTRAGLLDCNEPKFTYSMSARPSGSSTRCPSLIPRARLQVAADAALASARPRTPSERQGTPTTPRPRPWRLGRSWPRSSAARRGPPGPRVAGANRLARERYVITRLVWTRRGHRGRGLARASRVLQCFRHARAPRPPCSVVPPPWGGDHLGARRRQRARRVWFFPPPGGRGGFAYLRGKFFRVVWEARRDEW